MLRGSKGGRMSSSTIPVHNNNGGGDDLEGGGGNPLLARSPSSGLNAMDMEMDPLHPSGKQRKRKKHSTASIVNMLPPRLWIPFDSTELCSSWDLYASVPL
ncbi:expressed unknown protein [Seminavis robusta]|uniref:Uncharacterized protein n=1 Tax=Seminavis robusta TaxID=568900 RepID=A0A9N8HYG2_9STRA|nr:expressed unknown protein [Seminavis robusta]|eukprot:Sro1988_g309680.1 n/a (101) ;mRNA; r:18559-18861